MVPHRPAWEAWAYRQSKRWYRLSGRLPEGAQTALTVGDRRVFLVHNPKCAGSSLKRMLGVSARRTTHSWPRDLFRPAQWQHDLFVVAVRHPLDRFLSSWRYHCRSGYGGKLVKRHGPLSHLSALEYFDFIQQYPENCGLQSLWTDYPSAQKPTCDLILRVEESALWPAQMQALGITPLTQEAPRANATEAGSQAASAELVAKVEDFYRSDYRRFGYAFEVN